jgi:hypothetical protein
MTNQAPGAAELRITHETDDTLHYKGFVWRREMPSHHNVDPDWETPYDAMLRLQREIDALLEVMDCGHPKACLEYFSQGALSLAPIGPGFASTCGTTYCSACAKQRASERQKVAAALRAFAEIVIQHEPIFNEYGDACDCRGCQWHVETNKANGGDQWANHIRELALAAEKGEGL